MLEIRSNIQLWLSSIYCVNNVLILKVKIMTTVTAVH